MNLEGWQESGLKGISHDCPLNIYSLNLKWIHAQGSWFKMICNDNFPTNNCCVWLKAPSEYFTVLTLRSCKIFGQTMSSVIKGPKSKLKRDAVIISQKWTTLSTSTDPRSPPVVHNSRFLVFKVKTAQFNFRLFYTTKYYKEEKFRYWTNSLLNSFKLFPWLFHATASFYFSWLFKI